MLIRTLLLLLLVLLLVRAVWRLLEGIVRGASDPRARTGRQSGAEAVKLVKDPVCGTFVVPGKAPSLVSAGRTIYFCSDKCREQYAGR